jgi:hypothetical protein
MDKKKKTTKEKKDPEFEMWQEAAWQDMGDDFLTEEQAKQYLNSKEI